ncbi:MAG: type II toxin-antitoxin system RelE/ParE family toxin [Candidatus Saccharibacteria bacterium]
MAEYRLRNVAREDLIRIHHFGVEKFGMLQADKYFNSFFDYFEIIAQRPFSFESVDYTKRALEDVLVALTRSITELMVISLS